MTLDNLAALVGLFAVLAVATERLVELFKPLLPFLIEGHPKAPNEPARRALNHLTALFAGGVIAWFAAPAIPPSLIPHPRDPAVIGALALLASGGSGFWNSVLGYVNAVQKIRKDVVDGVRDSAGTLSPGVRAARLAKRGHAP